MKKVLLLLVLISTIISPNLYAFETGQSKEDLARTVKPDPTSTQVVDMEEPDKDPERDALAIIFATAIILIILGLLSTFVTRFALSLRSDDDEEKNDNIEKIE